LRSAAQLAPREADPFYRLGLIASALGDSKLALEYWSKAIELRPTLAEANFMIGEELLKRRVPENAVRFYARALELDPGKLIYHIRLGVAHVRTNSAIETPSLASH